MSTKGYVYAYPIVAVKIEVDPLLSDAEMIDTACEALRVVVSGKGVLWSEFDQSYDGFGVTREPAVLGNLDEECPITWYEADGKTPQPKPEGTY